MSGGSDSERMLRERHDREQIRQITYRNMRHLDLKRWDEMAETFTVDATTAWIDGEWKISHSGHEYLYDETFKRSDLPSHEVLYSPPFRS